MYLGQMTSFEENLWARTFDTSLDNMLKLPAFQVEGKLLEALQGCASLADAAVMLARKRTTKENSCT